MRKRLSDEVVRGLKPPQTGQVLVWDDLVTGSDCGEGLDSRPQILRKLVNFSATAI